MPSRYAALLILILASPAAARSEGQLPEGSSLIVIALGVLGVLIGRRASMRPRRRPKPLAMERETVPAQGGQPPVGDIQQRETGHVAG